MSGGVARGGNTKRGIASGRTAHGGDANGSNANGSNANDDFAIDSDAKGANASYYTLVASKLMAKLYNLIRLLIFTLFNENNLFVKNIPSARPYNRDAPLSLVSELVN